jgi:predicted ThiF/HesA family dinucleotide-utilizing enzyme
MMAGFTFIKAVSTVFIITFRKTSEDITRSAIANITNSIIAIILSRGTNIPDTQGIPQERKNGGTET